MKSENFEVVNGKIVMREAAVLNYAKARPKTEEKSETEMAPEPDKPQHKPMTVISTIVGKIMKGDLKVDPQVISKCAEQLNKNHRVAKEPNKELLKHIVDGLADGTYACDENVLKTVAETLNKAQQMDNFEEKEPEGKNYFPH